MNESYEVRAGWSCVQQMRALRELLTSVGCDDGLATEIDDIYRPALETLEAERNEAQDAIRGDER